jgi:hypothetical protein
MTEGQNDYHRGKAGLPGRCCPSGWRRRPLVSD